MDKGTIKTNDNMWRCFNCKYFDQKKSTNNYIVCLGKMPLGVMIDMKSENCDKYVGRREQNSSK